MRRGRKQIELFSRTDVAKRSLYRMPYALCITMVPTFAPKGNKVIGEQQSLPQGDGEVEFPYDLVAMDSTFTSSTDSTRY